MATESGVPSVHGPGGLDESSKDDIGVRCRSRASGSRGCARVGALDDLSMPCLQREAPLAAHRVTAELVEEIAGHHVALAGVEMHRDLLGQAESEADFEACQLLWGEAQEWWVVVVGGRDHTTQGIPPPLSSGRLVPSLPGPPETSRQQRRRRAPCRCTRRRRGRRGRADDPVAGLLADLLEVLENPGSDPFGSTMPDGGRRACGVGVPLESRDEQQGSNDLLEHDPIRQPWAARLSAEP